MATTTRYATDEDLLHAPRDGQKYERVDGEMRVSPAGGRAVIVRLTIRLGAFVAERNVGTRLVWVIDPESRTAVAYRGLTDVRAIGETDMLDGEDVVPEFVCPLKDVLG